MEKEAPVLVPTTSLFDIFAIRLGHRAMKPPDENPKKTGKSTMPAIFVVGSQMVKQETAHRIAMALMSR